MDSPNVIRSTFSYFFKIELVGRDDDLSLPHDRLQ
jgi:hypothetical protein